MEEISKETAENYWNLMKLPSETVRYLLIDYSCIGDDFIYHAFEESDLRGTEEMKMKYMFEYYFGAETDEDNHANEELLLVDVKNMKAYTLRKELKYVKKVIK
jgi:hypothetical protein